VSSFIFEKLDLLKVHKNSRLTSMSSVANSRKRLFRIRKFIGKENVTLWGHYDKSKGYSVSLREFLTNDNNFNNSMKDRADAIETFLKENEPVFM